MIDYLLNNHLDLFQVATIFMLGIQVGHAIFVPASKKNYQLTNNVLCFIVVSMCVVYRFLK